VGYPSGPDGGLWVLEYETALYGVKKPRNLLKADVFNVLLAKTMDMKCEIFKSLGAKFRQPGAI
jgi:hypothetical protein